MLRALGAALALAMLATVGLVAVGRGLQRAGAANGAPLLPHLVADPPDGIEMVESAENPETGRSEGPTRLLLKFNGYVHNKGPGAVDFRGSREKPRVSSATEAEVEHARWYHENLPKSVEEELAVPPMNVFQRLFTTNIGEEETNIERAHKDEPSGDQMIYVSADGHHHWHLQRVAKYGLFNSSKSAEIEAASKVGFCLDDSEHVEPTVGPATKVYADKTEGPNRDFCQEYQPNATGVFEGISPGWRDLYKSNLAFQWVDLSNVSPGEYWLGVEVNPLGLIKETGGGGKSNFATKPTIVPGFDAQPQIVKTGGHSIPVELASKAWADSRSPSYQIVTPPAHGTLSEVKGNLVTYTPEPGYGGADSFQFAARDAASKFPEHPYIATVTVEGPPSVAISGAQSEIVAGTSIPLMANVSNDSGAVEWGVSGGSITASGSLGRQATFQAPSEAGVVTITARLANNPAVSAQQAIKIGPMPTPKPAPEPPVSQLIAPSGSGVAGTKAVSPKPGVSRPQAMYIGRYLVMSTLPTVAGRVRLAAYAGKRLLGECTTKTPGARRFTCRVTRKGSVSRLARISVLASLRVGSLVYSSRLPAERILEMRMKHATGGAHVAAAGDVYWCTPSLVPDFGGGEE